MTEEEARTILKSRLDRWQVYLGEEKPFVSGPAPKDTMTTNGLDASSEISLALAVLQEKPEEKEVHEASVRSTNQHPEDPVPDQAARIAALEAAVSYEREQARRLSEAIAREQQLHAVTMTTMARQHHAPSRNPMASELPIILSPMSEPSVSATVEQRRQAVLILISVTALLGLCGIFVYLLFAM